jgi:hypothetical protein
MFFSLLKCPMNGPDVIAWADAGAIIPSPAPIATVAVNADATNPLTTDMRTLPIQKM